MTRSSIQVVSFKMDGHAGQHSEIQSVRQTQTTRQTENKTDRHAKISRKVNINLKRLQFTACSHPPDACIPRDGNDHREGEGVCGLDIPHHDEVDIHGLD